MSTISLSTVPGERTVLSATVGTVPMGIPGEALRMRVWEVRHDWGEVQLTTGGTLQPLKGQFVFYRGETTVLEEGTIPRVGALWHSPARPGDGGLEFGAEGESFGGNAYLSDAEFERAVQLSQAGLELHINLDFGGVNSKAVQYGPNPDGSVVVWDTKGHPTAFIHGLTIGVALAPTVAAAPSANAPLQEQEPVDPRAKPPTAGLVSDGYAQVCKRLDGIQASVTTLRNAVVILGIVLVVAMIFVGH